MNSQEIVVESSEASSSAKPGMTRSRYCLHVLALVAGFWGFAIVLTLMGSLAQHSRNTFISSVAVVVFALFALVFIVLSLRWTWLRIRDAGYPGWYIFLINLIPVVGILVYFTPTNYRETRKKDGWMICGLILCGVYVVVMFFRLLPTLKGTGAPQKRHVDERLSVVAPVTFRPVALATKGADPQERC
jgi:uncharacterized membrane protein YhaH (DUF805 family)